MTFMSGDARNVQSCALRTLSNSKPQLICKLRNFSANGRNFARNQPLPVLHGYAKQSATDSATSKQLQRNFLAHVFTKIVAMTVLKSP